MVDLSDFPKAPPILVSINPKMVDMFQLEWLGLLLFHKPSVGLGVYIV